MVKLHVDMFLSLLDKFKEKEGRPLDWKQGRVDKYIITKYGGNPSVRKPEDAKILISFGHDEAIFRKNTFFLIIGLDLTVNNNVYPKKMVVV